MKTGWNQQSNVIVSQLLFGLRLVIIVEVTSLLKWTEASEMGQRNPHLHPSEAVKSRMQKQVKNTPPMRKNRMWLKVELSFSI